MIKINLSLCVISLVIVFLSSVSVNIVGSIAVSSEGTDTLPVVSDPDIFNSGPGEFIHTLGPGPSTASLAVIDYDGDGDLDYIEGGAAIFMVKNNDGQFERKRIYLFPENPDTGNREIGRASCRERV